MNLDDKEYRIKVAQALSDAGLYKAGDSLDYKKVTNYGLISIFGSLLTTLFAFTQTNALNSIILLSIGVGYGCIKYNKEKKWRRY